MGGTLSICVLLTTEKKYATRPGTTMRFSSDEQISNFFDNPCFKAVIFYCSEMALTSYQIYVFQSLQRKVLGANEDAKVLKAPFFRFSLMNCQFQFIERTMRLSTKIVNIFCIFKFPCHYMVAEKRWVGNRPHHIVSYFKNIRCNMVSLCITALGCLWHK